MKKFIDLEKIAAMNVQQRRTLYNNARKTEGDDARLIERLIVENRLLVSNTGGLPHEDPVILKIEEVIQSPAGRAAAKKATDEGLPAMAGVDPLLRSGLGDDYGTYDTTSWAGTFVAAEMEQMGYVQTQKKPLPTGSVAKTAAFFVKRK